MKTKPLLNPRIPKKKRRLITVNGELYEYCVSGNWDSTRLYVRSLVSGDEKQLWAEYVFPAGPGLVRDLILDGEATAKVNGLGYSFHAAKHKKS